MRTKIGFEWFRCLGLQGFTEESSIVSGPRSMLCGEAGGGGGGIAFSLKGSGFFFARALRALVLRASAPSQKREVQGLGSREF